MLLPGYDLEKAAQVVAFFAMKQGGSINVLKLAKLVYLAERQSLEEFDEPMLYDDLVSMPEGPVASVTLNFINGMISDPLWSKMVGQRSGREVPLAHADLAVSDLDHLSVADCRILDGLWERFGAYDRFRLRDWTHVAENVPEWVDPQGSSNPIRHTTVFAHLGRSNPDELARRVDEVREISKVLR